MCARARHGAPRHTHAGWIYLQRSGMECGIQEVFGCFFSLTALYSGHVENMNSPRRDTHTARVAVCELRVVSCVLCAPGGDRLSGPTGTYVHNVPKVRSIRLSLVLQGPLSAHGFRALWWRTSGGATTARLRWPSVPRQLWSAASPALAAASTTAALLLLPAVTLHRPAPRRDQAR